MFLPEARQTIAQADRALRTAQRVRQGAVGRLALAFTTSGPFVRDVSRAFYAFRQAWPEVELTLKEAGRDEQIAGLDDGQIDIGMIRSLDPPELPAGMTSRLLLTENVLLAMPENHRLAATDAPIRLEELGQEHFVLYDPVTGAGFNEHFVARCARAGFVPKVSQEASSLATMLGLVSAGFGMTPLLRSLSRLHPEQIVYREFEGEGLVSNLWLIHRDPVSPTARNFLACIDAD